MPVLLGGLMKKIALLMAVMLLLGSSVAFADNFPILTNSWGNYTPYATTPGSDYKIPDSDIPWLYMPLAAITNIFSGTWWLTDDKTGTEFDFTSLGASGNGTDSHFSYVQNGLDLRVSRLDGGNFGDKQWHVQKMKLQGDSLHTINYDIQYDGGGPNDVVPEPISTTLFLLGGGALATRAFNRKKNK
jgi:hypothetical protein